ncbi:hypothetical protein [Streptomyces nodosus]|uniref:Uncharacterized protein n=2 Tax=Streptomyces nodosus TaxID=40318 RepID=A0A5P2W8C4_9ACTN|nr:hypothetical protein [Streptomyces nodosus]MBB4793997.1 drug/metabolite transporter (DMT)-like permease [Streptomyces nodosus]QEV41172.1 hypothetical protein CP978_23775 [Streptomyces nodosus]
MTPLFTLFGPPAITLFLFVVGALPYALWVTRRKPSRPARWAVIGSAAAIAAYGAGTVYGLAFTNPLDLCAVKTGHGVYMDEGRDYSLISVSVDSFPPSVICHWASGHSTEVVWFWTAPLLYAGLACSVVCFALLLINRNKRRKALDDNQLDA